MDDFADFSAAPNNQNPVEDFLAREAALRQQLGESEAIFGGADAPVSASSEPNQPSFEPTISQNAVMSSVSVDASPKPNAVTPSAFSAPKADALSYVPVKSAEDSEPVKKWKEKQMQQIAAKDKEAEEKRKETLAKAKKDLENFYAEYKQNKEKQIKRNKEQEQEYLKLRDSKSDNQPFWERVAMYIDFNAGKKDAVKATSIAKNAQAANSAPEPAPKRDLSRFKAILLQLKNDPNAPGNKPVAAK